MWSTTRWVTVFPDSVLVVLVALGVGLGVVAVALGVGLGAVAVAVGVGEALVALADVGSDPAVSATDGDDVGKAGSLLDGDAASLGLEERSVAAGLAGPVTGGAV